MGNIWTESYGERYVSGYDLEKLKMDQCYSTIHNQDYDQMFLYSKYKECLQCPFIYEETILKDELKTFIFDTKFAKYYRLLLENMSISEEMNNASVIGPNHFGYDYMEFGIYTVKFENGLYEFKTLKEPAYIYFPILTVFLIYALLFSLIPIGRFLWTHLKFQRLDLPFVEKVKSANNSKRVQSLDTFRGISIVMMIFVNYGHGGYAFLEHAVWNGLYVGDLVFPWFLWIMGVCIPISITSHFKKENAKASDAIKNITKRSIKLFAIGLFLGASPYLDKLRIFGILQRFAICYFVVGTVYALAYNKTSTSDTKNYVKHIEDLIKLKYQWAIMLLLMMTHCLLTFCLPIPNCPKGYLGPGGLHENKKHENCTGGAAGYIDEVILGNHIYQNAYIVEIFKSKPFDPEGILGCLTSIFQVFLGVQAGTILLTYKGHNARIFRWLVWSSLCGIIGGLLCGFSSDDGVIPVNKNLWSLSFVLVTSCFAFVLLSICYLVIDVWRLWSGKPFLFAGMNAILMYIGHNMTYESYFPIHWYLSAEEVNPTHFLTLLENIWATSFWVLVSYFLFKIKFFWTV